ncbi:MAG: arsenate reductase ArsC [Halobacteria archaeon]
MAEGFFNHLYAGRARASSGGVKAGDGPDPLAIRAMAEIGVDISKQRSKAFTEEMLRSAHAVVKVCSEFDRACPVLPVPAVHWNVENPHGKSIEVFRKVRDDVRRRVEAMEREFPELFKVV